MMNNMQSIDPIRKQGQKEGDEGLSPMDPPDAYSPPQMDAVDYERMHPFLKTFMDEHELFVKELDAFESAIQNIETHGIDKEVNQKLKAFFQFFDENFIPHHQREEKTLFPALHDRLIEKGEHGQGWEPVTATRMMEDDHIRALQLAATTFNLFALSIRLPDQSSRLIVLDTALHQGKALVELMRLHIFRENTIVFSLAQKIIPSCQLDDMQKKTLSHAKN